MSMLFHTFGSSLTIETVTLLAEEAILLLDVVRFELTERAEETGGGAEALEALPAKLGALGAFAALGVGGLHVWVCVTRAAAVAPALLPHLRSSLLADENDGASSDGMAGTTFAPLFSCSIV